MLIDLINFWTSESIFFGSFIKNRGIFIALHKYSHILNLSILFKLQQTSMHFTGILGPNQH